MWQTNPEPPKNINWLTPKQVAKLMLVSPITVRQWAQRGLLDYRTTPGGHRRFSLEMVQRFARRAGLTTRLGNAVRTSALVVDADAQMNRFLVSLLEAFDNTMLVSGAVDCFDAGFKAKQFQPDVILFDPMMAGFDAFRVCRVLKAEQATAHVRLVAITGEFSDENIERLRAAGADAFVAKPFSNEEVLSAAGLTVAEAHAEGNC